MFVIRPQHILGTPRQLARDLGCETRFYPNNRRDRTFDYRTDFMMIPVAPNDLRNAPEDYVSTYQFSTRNKHGQRQALINAGIPAPAAASTRTQSVALSGNQFVVRPLRHSRGAGYRVTADRSDFREGAEYISELFPKRREYRIIFVFGQPVIFLRKKPHEGVGNEEPWGHVNSTFQTINDVAGSKIGQTDAADKLSAYRPVSGAHICAADILWNDRAEQPWVCLELNFCPALDIDNNRAKVVTAIRNRNRPVQAPVVRVNPRIAEIDARLVRIAAIVVEKNRVVQDLQASLREQQGLLQGLDQEAAMLQVERAQL